MAASDSAGLFVGSTQKCGDALVVRGGGGEGLMESSGGGALFQPYKVVLAFLLGLLFFHDFIFLTVEYRFGGHYGLNLWKELVALAFLFVLVCWVLLRTALSPVNVRIFLVLGMLLVSLPVFGDLSEGSLRTFRSIFTPFVFAVIVGRLVGVDAESRSRYFSRLVLLVAVVSGIYGVYQLLSIKHWQEFWYYHPLVAMGLKIYEYDSFRNGMPRISGFFTSPLEFAFFITFVFFIGLAVLVSERRESSLWVVRKRSLLSLAMLAFFVYVVSQSTVRSAQMCLVSAFAYLLLLVRLRSRFAIVTTAFLYVLVLSSATFLYIGLGYTDDLSALGRLVQWSFVLAKVVASPLGLGFSAVGPGQQYWFDSLWLNLAASFGVFSLLFVIGFVACYLRVVGIYVSLRGMAGGRIKSLSLAALVIMPVFFYGALFQSFYNSPGFYLLLMIVSVVLYGAKNARA